MSKQLQAARLQRRLKWSAFEDELRFIEKLIYNNELESVVFYAPNTRLNPFQDSDVLNEMIRHSFGVKMLDQDHFDHFALEIINSTELN
jgi:hypothetical protein